MAETIRLSTIENGGQWWKSIACAADAFRNAGMDVGLDRDLGAPDTIDGSTGIVSHFAPWVLLPLDEDIARTLEREHCAPVTNPGFELVVNKDLPNDVAYLSAKALNESSARHWMAQDVFYRLRHAPETSAPLHPGAARYYREHGVLN